MISRYLRPGQPVFLSDGDNDANNASALPERSEIAARYKWQLERIFPDWEAWEACFAEIETELPALARLQGTLAESGARLRHAIETIHATRRKLEKGMVFAGMKSEQAAFGERFRQALKRRGLTQSASELAGLLASHGGVSVAPQAISAWLHGKSLPRPQNMRALARLLHIEPQELQFGSTRKVRESPADWRAGAAPRNALDQHAINAFLVLPAAQRKLVRELIDQLGRGGKATG